MAGSCPRFAATVLLCAPLAACAGASRHAPPDVGRGGVGVTVIAPVKRFPITAATVAGMRAELRRDGPRINGRSWDGATHWSLRWTYGLRNEPGSGCRVHGVRVEVRADITMPEWLPTVESDDDTKRWWRRYESGLMAHEAEHARLAVDAGNRIRRAVEGRIGMTCDALRASANAEGQKILDEMRAQQARYDIETRHGGTQIAAAMQADAP